MLNIKQEPSPYFSNRGNWKITGVVIHTTVGNYEGTLNWFKSNPNKVSSHYVVREDGGEITQMVAEDKASHHAGVTKNPSTPVYRGSNPNFYTIGIENADGGNPHKHIRDNQYKVLGELVRDICKRYNIPIDRDHVCGHKELRSDKTCPGNIDVDKVVRLAKELENKDNMPDYLKTLLLENNLNTESDVRAFFEKARRYDEDTNNLQEQIKSVNEALSDRASQVSILTEENQKLKDAKAETEEILNKIRSEKDKIAWERDRMDIELEAKTTELIRAKKKIEGMESKKPLMGYTWIERFKSLWRR